MGLLDSTKHSERKRAVVKALEVFEGRKIDKTEFRRRSSESFEQELYELLKGKKFQHLIAEDEINKDVKIDEILERVEKLARLSPSKGVELSVEIAIHLYKTLKKHVKYIPTWGEKGWRAFRRETEESTDYYRMVEEERKTFDYNYYISDDLWKGLEGYVHLLNKPERCVGFVFGCEHYMDVDAVDENTGHGYKTRQFKVGIHAFMPLEKAYAKLSSKDRDKCRALARSITSVKKQAAYPTRYPRIEEFGKKVIEATLEEMKEDALSYAIQKLRGAHGDTEPLVCFEDRFELCEPGFQEAIDSFIDQAVEKMGLKPGASIPPLLMKSVRRKLSQAIDYYLRFAFKGIYVYKENMLKVDMLKRMKKAQGKITGKQTLITPTLMMKAYTSKFDSIYRAFEDISEITPHPYVILNFFQNRFEDKDFRCVCISWNLSRNQYERMRYIGDRFPDVVELYEKFLFEEVFEYIDARIRIK